MLLLVRVCLLLATLGLGTGGYIRGSETYTMTVADPRASPEFADIAGFDAVMATVNPQTPHQEDFAAALAAYNKEAAAISDQVSKAEKTSRQLFIGAAVCLFLFFMSLFPWTRWLDRAEGSMVSVADDFMGVLSKGAKAAEKRRKPSLIVGRDGLTSYSVADELAKWSKLRDDGVVTDAEFNDARARLLNRADTNG